MTWPQPSNRKWSFSFAILTSCAASYGDRKADAVKVYVTGAGASKAAGYPLGWELLPEINAFIGKSGPCSTDFDYLKDWPRVREWLRQNDNFLIREAYQTGNLENIFSVLDFAQQLGEQSLLEYATQSLKIAPDPKVAGKAEADYHRVSTGIAEYADARRILLLALKDYLEQKHYDDQSACSGKDWDYLRSFGNKLCPGDVAITFNYDSTLERVLYSQGKWFPSDGYGFRMIFQKTPQDETRVEFRDSPVKILHLHGATGWYLKPDIKYPERLPGGGGSYPIEAHAPAPLDTYIGLAPKFLVDLGIAAVDASLTARPANEPQVFIHPSFFKNYESPVFVDLWTKAAEYLRNAEEIFIIGYSLPPADSAALTLFATSCHRKSVRVVDPESAVRYRIYQIVRSTSEVPHSFSGRPVWDQPSSFQEWLNEAQDCN
jgi:hypothetical protein